MSGAPFVPRDLNAVHDLSFEQALALFHSGQEAVLAPDTSHHDLLEGESALRVEKRRAHIQAIRNRIAFDASRAALASGELPPHRVPQPVHPLEDPSRKRFASTCARWAKALGPFTPPQCQLNPPSATGSELAEQARLLPAAEALGCAGALARVRLPSGAPVAEVTYGLRSEEDVMRAREKRDRIRREEEEWARARRQELMSRAGLLGAPRPVGEEEEEAEAGGKGAAVGESGESAGSRKKRRVDRDRG